MMTFVQTSLHFILQEIDGNIAQQAVEHIHANEVILTFAASNTVSLFLAEASKKRNFQVPGWKLFASFWPSSG